MVMINVSSGDKAYSDTMSIRSHRSRVTFYEDIEMDSLEPEVNNGTSKIELGTICENLDESFADFKEFDVSYCEERRV
jgi:hypothetical protein